MLVLILLNATSHYTDQDIFMIICMRGDGSIKTSMMNIKVLALFLGTQINAWLNKRNCMISLDQQELTSIIFMENATIRRTHLKCKDFNNRFGAEED